MSMMGCKSTPTLVVMAAVEQTKKHKITFRPNCIKKVLQKNEEIGKIRVDASETLNHFMQLLTSDVIQKCSDVLSEKNANRSESEPQSKVNVTPNNKKQKQSSKMRKNPRTQNLITIDVLHQAIKNEESLKFIDNVITEQHPNINELSNGKSIKKEKKSKEKKRKRKRKEMSSDEGSNKNKRKRRKKDTASENVDESKEKFTFENVFCA